jgi:hypothetical protein
MSPQPTLASTTLSSLLQLGQTRTFNQLSLEGSSGILLAAEWSGLA